jgi:hypothetical protein
MALRLVRQTSDTPNITNKDDTIMTRYAYGGYNSVIKSFGNECGYNAESGVFNVLDGRIVIDGWEVDIDGGGWILDLSAVTETQYHSVYVEVNIAAENAKLDSVYATDSYPNVDKGDDLTAIPNGTARLLLYNVKVSNSVITEVIKRFSTIEYLKDIKDRLEGGGLVPKYTNYLKVYDLYSSSFDGHFLKAERNGSALTKLYLAGGGTDYDSVLVNDSQHVNGLAIEHKKDERNRNILRIGDIIIPQKRLLFNATGGLYLTTSVQNYTKTLSFDESMLGKVLEIEIRDTGNATNNSIGYFRKVRVGSLNPFILYQEIIKTGGSWTEDNTDYDFSRAIILQASLDGKTLTFEARLDTYHVDANYKHKNYYISTIYEIIE